MKTGALDFSIEHWVAATVTEPLPPQLPHQYGSGTTTRAGLQKKKAEVEFCEGASVPSPQRWWWPGWATEGGSRCSCQSTTCGPLPWAESRRRRGGWAAGTSPGPPRPWGCSPSAVCCPAGWPSGNCWSACCSSSGKRRSHHEGWEEAVNVSALLWCGAASFLHIAHYINENTGSFTAKHTSTSTVSIRNTSRLLICSETLSYFFSPFACHCFSPSGI